ncbi:cupin domain-containing protein [Nocardioides sp. LHD-245]|uniref:cupin domain-containing protein n=1 Tax=Nocardioides sp. LHD-245 TaxID=3051387 RepID=UPI0027E1DD3E|nr:cupin domain-containing protein [Nocardioides sp. LHD-245]
MESTSLIALVREQVDAARAASSGRAAVTVYGGREHRLRQTLIALKAGERLGEHDAPDEATLQVLEGEVALHAGGETWRGEAGDHLVIPPQRHDLEALTDAAVLLTVAN